MPQGIVTPSCSRRFEVLKHLTWSSQPSGAFGANGTSRSEVIIRLNLGGSEKPAEHRNLRPADGDSSRETVAFTHVLQ